MQDVQVHHRRGRRCEVSHGERVYEREWEEAGEGRGRGGPQTARQQPQPEDGAQEKQHSIHILMPVLVRVMLPAARGTEVHL